jgi:hypothetical protein
LIYLGPDREEQTEDARAQEEGKEFEAGEFHGSDILVE